VRWTGTEQNSEASLSHLARDCSMHYRTSLFGLVGNPLPKFTKIGGDLLPTQFYHPAKFHRSASTHAKDIRYKNLRTKKERRKETVNDISPAWLSACGDNNTPIYKAPYREISVAITMTTTKTLRVLFSLVETSYFCLIIIVKYCSGYGRLSVCVWQCFSIHAAEAAFRRWSLEAPCLDSELSKLKCNQIASFHWTLWRNEPFARRVTNWQRAVDA